MNKFLSKFAVLLLIQNLIVDPSAINPGVRCVFDRVTLPTFLEQTIPDPGLFSGQLLNHEPGAGVRRDLASFPRPWWLNPLHILWSSLISDTGTGIEMFVTAHFLESHFRMPYLVPMTAAFFIFGRFLFTFWGGRLADRNGKAYFIRVILARTVPSLMAGALIALHLIRPWHLVGLAFLNGVGLGFSSAVYFSILFEPTHDRPHLAGLPGPVNQTKNALGLALGPFLGEWIVHHWGSAIGYFVNAATYLAYLVGIAFIQFPDHSLTAKPEIVKNRFWDSARARIHKGIEEPMAFAVFAIMGITAVLGYPLLSLIPALLGQAHASSLASMQTAFLSGSFLATAFALVIELRMARITQTVIRRLEWPGIGILGIALILVAHFPTSQWGILAVSMAGFTYNWFVLVAVKFVGLVNKHLHGRAISVQQVTLFGAQSLGLLAAGFLARHHLEEMGLYMSGLFLMAVTLLTGIYLKGKMPILKTVGPWRSQAA